MDCLRKICKIGPRFLLPPTTTTAVVILESLLPVHLIGASVIALSLGMLLSYFWRSIPVVQTGVRFISKRTLKLAITLSEAPLSIQTVLHVGRHSLVAVCFALFTCFGGGCFVGKALGLSQKLSNLIPARIDICGGPAIAATAPAVDARDRDIAYAVSATFLLGMATILLSPIMGRAMGLSDVAYGLWSGTAVNDTPSVMAAGHAFSETAGDFVTMVRPTRTLPIIPTVIIFALIEIRPKHKEAAATGPNGDIRADIKFPSLFPWLILGFLALAFINSLGFISPSLSLTLKEMNKFLTVVFPGAIDLSTSFKEMHQSSAVPMLHGFIILALVVIVAIGAEYSMGITWCGITRINIWESRAIFSII